MTNEEALNAINSLIRQFTRLEQPTAVEGLEVAKNALEKQIPAEVGVNASAYGTACFYCPKCLGISVVGEDGSHDVYCWRCGQKLDWGEDDDE